MSRDTFESLDWTEGRRLRAWELSQQGWDPLQSPGPWQSADPPSVKAYVRSRSRQSEQRQQGDGEDAADH